MIPSQPRRQAQPATIRRYPADAERWTRERCHIVELSNGPHDPALSIARARVAPGVTTRWHRLVDITERYVIVEGRGTVEVGDAAPADVGPGDTVLIAPGLRQRITNAGTGDLVFLALCTPRFAWDRYEDVDEAVDEDVDDAAAPRDA